ncbi:MAG: enoyl-CoA hydratase/isomerase family protein [bacterium]|nr:enoyl-CoA hydratase/isomerase family protein [bacterium]
MDAPKLRALKYEEVEPGICLITVDNPKSLNALTRDMQRDLITFAEFLDDNDDARVGIITGAGEKSFISGIDLAGIEPDTRWFDENALKDACARFEACHKPIIAMINGYCIGGGLELASACDLRIFADTAKVALPELGLGFIPGAGGMQRLVRLAGVSVAKAFAMSGRKFMGEELKTMNIAYDVVPKEDLYETTMAVARRLANEMAPLAIAYAKRMINSAFDMDKQNALLYEDVISKALSFTEDADEGPRAFLEKRPKNFKGR